MNKSHSNFSRKRFLGALTLSTVGSILLPTPSFSQVSERGPQLAPELVNEFVRAGHGNLSEVKRMLSKEPTLLHASWDWGGGDFETAIDAAAHMGSRDVAVFLLEKGARMNLFVAAMLGKLKFIKTLEKVFPDQLMTTGAHGLSLMHHALKGGKEAEKVVEYLKKQGIES